MSAPQIRGWLPLAAAAIAFAAGLVITGVALLGGSSPERADAAAARPALKPVGSCDGLRSYLRRHGARSAAPLPAAGERATAAPLAEDAAAAGGTTQPTNVQEAGVDEPDIVKSAGSTLFTVDGNVLRAVDTGTDAPVLSDSIELPRREGAPVSDYQLLVAGDRLLAIGNSYGYAVPVAGGDVGVATDVAYPVEPRTVIAEVDVSDPTALAISRTMTYEGAYVSARLTGSTVRLVSASHPAAGAAESGHGRALVPEATVRDRSTGARRTGPLLGCADVRWPSRFAGAGMLTVLTIDLDRGLPAVDADAVLTDGQIVYASTTALYVATERWTGATDPSGSQVRTQIHRFDTTDPDSTGYVASGAVTGHMLSQWSMSEHDGLLRVASTTSPPWDAAGQQQGDSKSFVTVLVPDGDRLRPVGRVGGLGRGEQVYAVRFIGDTGYVVTFRQVDPLYVLDLSHPTDPRVTGELKIPGYSAYLHPVGPGLLLGVGRDADAGGTTSGVQASLFDVSDPAQPLRLDREPFGGSSSSEVEFDHHAFFWFAAGRLAMLPVDSYAGGRERHLAIGLRVSPGSADPLGRVAKLAAGSSYRSQVRRTVEVGDRVYTVAANGIGAYDSATLSPIARLRY
jgi:uncharacterized secreted protein with C-terminal beta-propeller domain